MDKNEKNTNLEELLKAIAASGAGIPIAGIRVMVEKAQDDGSQEIAGKDTASQGTASTGTVSKEPMSQKPVSKETTPATESKEHPSEPSNPVSISIKNLHIHMDERMTTNYGPGALAGVYDEDSDGDSCGCCDHSDDDAIDIDEMIRYICRHTGLCERVILTVLDAQIDYLDTVFDEEDEA